MGEKSPACLASKTLGLHLFRAALVATSAALTVAASLVHSDPLKCCFFLISLGALVLCGPLPAPVAALFPVFVLPLIGLAASEEVAKIYLEMPQLSFLSVMFVVIAASKNGVYNRLALLILCNVGSSTSALLLLVMVPAVVLSLVVDHYLSSMLLMPIVDSLVDEIFTGRDKEAKPEPGDRRPKRTNLFSPPTQLVLQESSPQPHTPFKSAHIDKSENTTYPLQHAVTFSSWVIYSLPGMIACCGVLWWYLSRHALPATLHEIRRDAYRVKYRHLGPIRFCETAVLLVTCGTLISHWATGGWYELLHNPKPLVPRTALLLAVGSLVFVVPAHPLEGLDSPPLLSWSAFREWMPWGCLLLCGAGMAVSHFAKSSGMDVAALRLVLVDSGAGPWPASLLLTLGVSLAAELRDPRHRDALALTPLLHELAVELRLNPVLLLLPATRASCVALVLPLPSYPNALLCDYAHIPTRELVKAGLLLKTTFLGSELLSLTILGRVLFDLNYVPDKATGSVNASTAPTLSPLTYGATP